MNEYRPISAQFSFFYPTLTQKLLSRFSPQDDSSFRFRTRERRVKTVNFDVGKNPQKLIGYCSNIPWTTVKLMSVLYSSYIHLSMLKRW